MSAAPSHFSVARPLTQIAAQTRSHAAIGFALVILSLAFSICEMGFAAPAFAQSKVDEYKLKAAFIFHFAQLTDWPSSNAAANSNDFVVCTFGSDPFEGELENTLAGKSIGSRNARVRHVKLAADARECQVVFVAAAEMKRLPELLSQLNGAPVMTVGETGGFIEQGGMLSFSEEDGKMRFEINLAPADRAGLKISSRLLVLAKNVLGNRGQG